MTIQTDVKLEEIELYDDEDEEDELSYRYYDNEENYWRLRQRRGDLAGIVHNDIVDYLVQILRHLYRFEKYTMSREVNFYETYEEKEEPLYPDVFVLKTKEQLKFKSYHLTIDGPAPQLIIEVMSDETRRVDLKEKPVTYQRWGVQEYFVYDPRPRKRNLKKPRLWGWRLTQGQYEPVEAQANGRMWSEQLDSWLVPDGELVRLYDKDNNQRLTGEEAKDRQIATQQQRADKLAQKLRELGVNPDEL